MPTIWLCGGFGWLCPAFRDWMLDVRRSMFDVPDREPGRFAVRNIEHRTSNIQHPISKGGAKPPKATTKPYSRHILGIDSGVQSHTKGTSKPPDSQPIGTPKPHQCDPKATPRLPQSHPKATPRPGRRGAGPTLRSHWCGFGVPIGW